MRVDKAWKLRICNVCEKDISGFQGWGRCTNGRCESCHRVYCTPGGLTSPGHERQWPGGMTEDTPLRDQRAK